MGGSSHQEKVDELNKVEGFSFYKCDGSCGYHFAVEFKDYTDDSEPIFCPTCGSENYSFVMDKEGETE